MRWPSTTASPSQTSDFETIQSSSTTSPSSGTSSVNSTRMRLCGKWKREWYPVVTTVLPRGSAQVSERLLDHARSHDARAAGSTRARGQPPAAPRASSCRGARRSRRRVLPDRPGASGTFGFQYSRARTFESMSEPLIPSSPTSVRNRFAAAIIATNSSSGTTCQHTGGRARASAATHHVRDGLLCRGRRGGAQGPTTP